MKRSLLVGSSIIVLFIGFFYYITLTTTNPLSEQEFPKTQEKAKTIAVEFFQKEQQLDVVITKVGVTGEIGYKVWVEGHVLTNEEKKISAIIDVATENRYKVISHTIS